MNSKHYANVSLKKKRRKYLGGSHVNSNHLHRAPYLNLEITPRAPYVKFKNIGLVLRSQESIGLEFFFIFDSFEKSCILNKRQEPKVKGLEQS